MNRLLTSKRFEKFVMATMGTLLFWSLLLIITGDTGMMKMSGFLGLGVFMTVLAVVMYATLSDMVSE